MNGYVSISSTECTRCHKETLVFYEKLKSYRWWNHYVKSGEKLCHDCMGKNPKFVREFEETIGVPYYYVG